MAQATFRARVEEILRDRLPQLDVSRVTSVDRLVGGLSFETYIVDTETSGGTQRFILRREPTGGPLAPYDVGFEAAIYGALAGTPVPVPQVFLHEADPGILERPFLVTEFVRGDASTPTSLVYEDPDTRDGVLARFVDMLATIHRVPVEGLPHGPGGASTGAGDEVRTWRKRFAEIELSPRPIVAHMLDVLEERAPADHPMVLVHGDYRLSNLLLRDGEIAAVLDWERSFIGDPLADVSFTRNKVLAGWCSISGPWAERYTELTGFEVDAQRIMFWQLLELAKTAYVGMACAAALVRGTSTDLRLLSVANAATAIEPAAARLLERFRSGTKGQNR